MPAISKSKQLFLILLTAIAGQAATAQFQPDSHRLHPRYRNLFLEAGYR